MIDALRIAVERLVQEKYGLKEAPEVMDMRYEEGFDGGSEFTPEHDNSTVSILWRERFLMTQAHERLAEAGIIRDATQTWKIDLEYYSRKNNPRKGFALLMEDLFRLSDPLCDHTSSEGIDQDFGPDKVWRCCSCNWYYRCITTDGITRMVPA